MSSPAIPYGEAVDRWQIEAALAALRPEHREVIQLVHFEGLSLRRGRQARGDTGRHREEPLLLRVAQPARHPGRGRRDAVNACPQLETVGAYVLGALEEEECRDYASHL